MINNNKIDNTPILISQANQEIKQYIYRQLEANGINDISPAHGDIIGALLMTRKMTLTDLAIKTNRTQATINTLVKKLATNGYVYCEKDITDRRKTYVCLAERGKSMEDVFHNISEQLYRITYQNVSDHERDIMRCVLEQIRNNFRGARIDG